MNMATSETKKPVAYIEEFDWDDGWTGYKVTVDKPDGSQAEFFSQGDWQTPEDQAVHAAAIKNRLDRDYPGAVQYWE